MDRLVQMSSPCSGEISVLEGAFFVFPRYLGVRAAWRSDANAIAECLMSDAEGDRGSAVSVKRGFSRPQILGIDCESRSAASP